MSSDTTESAVSEVIGVILVVALTVIMAAIIAAFVFGMVDSFGTPRIISVTVLQTSPRPSRSPTGADRTREASRASPSSGRMARSSSVSLPKVGQSWQASGNNVTPLYKDHVVVTAHFPNKSGPGRARHDGLKKPTSVRTAHGSPQSVNPFFFFNICIAGHQRSFG